MLCKSDPKMVYCGLFEQGEKIRVIVYAGDEISKEKSAGDIVKSISQILGGAGGGSAKFAQGGGTDKSKKEDAIKKCEVHDYRIGKQDGNKLESTRCKVENQMA